MPDTGVVGPTGRNRASRLLIPPYGQPAPLTLRVLGHPHHVILCDGRCRIPQDQPTDQLRMPDRTRPGDRANTPAEHRGPFAVRLDDDPSEIIGPLHACRRLPVRHRIREPDPATIEHDQATKASQPFQEPVRDRIVGQGLHREEKAVDHDDLDIARRIAHILPVGDVMFARPRCI